MPLLVPIWTTVTILLLCGLGGCVYYIVRLEKRLLKPSGTLSELVADEGSSNQTLVEPNWSLLAVKDGRVRDDVWKWIQSTKVKIVLEPKTANTHLRLSNDSQKVFLTNLKSATNDPLRFSACTCIIGRDSFRSRFYFEVQLLSSEWSVGITYNNAKTTITPLSDDVWSIGIKKDKFYTYMTVSKLLDKPVPKILGVHVNYQKGTVAFYNIETQEFITVLSAGRTFTRPVVPFFFGVRVLAVIGTGLETGSDVDCRSATGVILELRL